MILDLITAKIISSPKKLFVIDGFGALLSAFLLGIVLVQFESVFGIPVFTLYILASLPILFALYDISAYYSQANKTPSLLKGIAILNLLYCFLSIGFAFYHLQTITTWGWIYFIGETLIVLTLSLVEYKVAQSLKQKVR